MLGISTAWKSKEVATGDELLKALDEIGINQTELDFRITSPIFQQLLPSIKQGRLKVLSVHNYFPLPDIIPLDKANADTFPLSSLDEAERRQGIHYTMKTVQVAHEIGARAVVVHLGRVDMGFQKKYYHQLYDSDKLRGEKGQLFLKDQKKVREIYKPRHLDELFDSLEKVLKEAEKLRIPIGIENRLHLNEIPNFDEIGLLLKKFSGSPLYYWHDTGHAAVQENLTIVEQKALLEAYSSSLLGVHLHDTRDYEDHLAPGRGTINFSSLLPFIKDGTQGVTGPIIKIVEAHPKVSREELLTGIDYLTSLGL